MAAAAKLASELRSLGYDVSDELGRGGFGVVYRARDLSLHRTVAIKVLETALDDEGRARFDRERQTTGLLSPHPFVVTVYATGYTDSGLPYIVMEDLAGGTLAARLRSLGKLPLHEALDVGVRMASALDAAHRLGILHRDVKPENILLSTYGEPKLADFGISTLPGAFQTRSGIVTASPLHAAPEVLEGERATVQSDVYSLASTLYALLSGKAPFQGDADEHPYALVHRVNTKAAPKLRAAGVPDAVARVVERALAKRPDLRPPSAEAFAASLQDAQRRLHVPPTEVPAADESSTVQRAALVASQPRRTLPRAVSVLTRVGGRRRALAAPVVMVVLSGAGVAALAATRAEDRGAQVLVAGSTTTTSDAPTEDTDGTRPADTTDVTASTEDADAVAPDPGSTAATGTAATIVAGTPPTAGVTPGPVSSTTAPVAPPPPSIDGLAIDGSSMNGGPFSSPQCQVTPSGGRAYSFSRTGTSMGRVYSGGFNASLAVTIGRPGEPPGPEFPDIPNHPPATHGTPATWFGAGAVATVDATVEVSSPQGRVTLVGSYVPDRDVGECEETATSSRMAQEADNGTYRDVRLAALPVIATIVRNGETWTDRGTCYLLARVMYIKARNGQTYGDASDLYATCTSPNAAATRA